MMLGSEQSINASNLHFHLQVVAVRLMETSLLDKIDCLRTVIRWESCPNFQNIDEDEETCSSDLQPTEVIRCVVQAETKVNNMMTLCILGLSVGMPIGTRL